MHIRHYRNPETFIDPDGTLCVRIPLANGKGEAEAYADDYANLLRKGITGNWHLNIHRDSIGRVLHRYIQCPAPTLRTRPNGRQFANQTVARLIAGIGRGRRISYADGNPLNLRRNNLQVVDGYARYNIDALRLPHDNEAQA